MKKAINIAKDYTIFLILILLGILFTIGNPAFLRFNNIITILRQSCIMGILGMGEMALIIVGGLILCGTVNGNHSNHDSENVSPVVACNHCCSYC